MNPYHDKNGRFTSADNAASYSGPESFPGYEPSEPEAIRQLEADPDGPWGRAGEAIDHYKFQKPLPKEPKEKKQRKKKEPTAEKAPRKPRKPRNGRSGKKNFKVVKQTPVQYERVESINECLAEIGHDDILAVCTNDKLIVVFERGESGEIRALAKTTTHEDPLSTVGTIDMGGDLYSAIDAFNEEHGTRYLKDGEEAVDASVKAIRQAYGV